MAKEIEARGAGDLARRSLNTTGQIFRYAMADGFAQRNPVSDIKPRDILKETHEKNFARIDQKELPALLRAIEFYRGTPVTRLALELMTLTFVRTSELIEAPWSEVDLDCARWDIPAVRMKQVGRMPTPHISCSRRKCGPGSSSLLQLRWSCGAVCLSLSGAGNPSCIAASTCLR